MMENSWVATQLASSQEGLSAVSQWVSQVQNLLSDSESVKKNLTILDRQILPVMLEPL
jgi:hypothetical protein